MIQKDALEFTIRALRSLQSDGADKQKPTEYRRYKKVQSYI